MVRLGFQRLLMLPIRLGGGFCLCFYYSRLCGFKSSLCN